MLLWVSLPGLTGGEVAASFMCSCGHEESADAEKVLSAFKFLLHVFNDVETEKKFCLFRPT